MLFFLTFNIIVLFTKNRVSMLLIVFSEINWAFNYGLLSYIQVS